MTLTSNTEIARLASITATERAIELNAATQARIDSGEVMWASTLIEDQAHWGENATGLDLERELLVGGFSDAFKEENGIRPRWVNFEGLTFSECEAQVERWLPTPTPEELEAREAQWKADRAFWEAQDALLEAEAAQAQANLTAAGEDALWALQDTLEGVRCAW
jgi:hypothetical protein